MIRLTGVSKTVTSGGQPLTILHSTDLVVGRGQSVAIVGPSGSGKSTLLGLIAGLDAPTTGTISIDGVEITTLGEDALARLRGQKIGFVFQFFHLIGSLTALDNVMVPMELAGARHAEARARELLAEVGLTGSVANAINNLGLVAGYQNDYATAQALHQECLEIYRALDEKSGIAIATGNLGHDAMHLGRLEEAHTWQSESLKLSREVGDKDGVTECLERFAMLANARASFKRAALLFGAASVLRKEAGTLLALADQAEYDCELKVTRTQLGSQSFETAWTKGQAMPLDQVIRQAIGEEET